MNVMAEGLFDRLSDSVSFIFCNDNIVETMEVQESKISELLLKVKALEDTPSHSDENALAALKSSNNKLKYRIKQLSQVKRS